MIAKWGNRKIKIITYLFCIIIAATFVLRDFIFFRNIYMYADIGGDTYSAYWPFYDYFYSSIKYNNFSFWSFSIGLGSNIFSIGNVVDIFNIPLLLIPRQYGPYALVFIMMTKLIFSFYFMYLYNRMMGVTFYVSAIISTLFSFSGYMFLWGQHYQFATTVALTALLLFSVEKIIQDNKGMIYAFSIFLLAITSIYFFFIAGITMLIYIPIRIYMINYNEKKEVIIYKMLYIGRYTLLGIGLSAFIMLPSAYMIVSNPRVSNIAPPITDLIKPNFKDVVAYIFRSINPLITYKIKYYNNEFYDLYQAPNIYMGMLPFVVLPIIGKYIVMQSQKMKIALFGTVSVILFLILSGLPKWLYNVFAAQNFRWHFTLIIFILFIISLTLNDFFENTEKYKDIVKFSSFIMMFNLFLTGLIIIPIIIGVELLSLKEIIKSCLLSITFILIYGSILVLYMKKKYESIKYIIFILVLIELSVSGFYISTEDREIVNSEFIKKTYNNSIANKIIDTDNSNDFFRIDNALGILNDSLVFRYHGVRSYTSLQLPSYFNLVEKMQIPVEKNWVNFNRGFYDISSLYSIASVKYYIGENPPVGFEATEISKVFKNKYFLPLGYTYNNYISENDFANLTKGEKEKVILYSAVLDMPERIKGNIELCNLEKIDYINAVDIINLTNPIRYNNIKLLSNSDNNAGIEYLATSGDPQIIFNVPNINTNGLLEFSVTSQCNIVGQVFWADIDNNYNETKSIRFDVSQGQKRYKIDLPKKNVDRIRIDIGNVNEIVNVSDIKIKYYNYNEKDYFKNINNLKLETLNVTKFSNSYIEGNICVINDRILFLSIPFDRGWKVYIDGNKVDYYRANLGFIGVPLSKGIHSIKLNYISPWLIQGMAVSISSFMIVIYLLFFKHRFSKPGGNINNDTI